MSVIEYVVLAIALSLEGFIVMHGAGRQTPIRLTKGLLECIMLSGVCCVMLAAGMWIGNHLRFSSVEAVDSTSAVDKLWYETDNLIYLGLMLVVAFKLFFKSFKKNRVVPAYDISRFSTTLLMSIAIGINIFIVGLALGFHVSFSIDFWRSVIPLFIVMFLFSYMGIMFGRRDVQIHPRRWTLFAVLFLLAFALKGAFWA